VKKIIFFILFCLLCLNVYSENIGLGKAEKVAINWMNEKAGYSYTINNIINRRFMIQEKDTLFYIIEFSPKGYIIISADNIAVPVIMYDPEGTFSDDIPPAADEIFKTRQSELLYAKKNGVESSIEIKKLWENYSSEPNLFHKKAVLEKVDPLITVTWNQSYPYNKFCPVTDTAGSGGRTWAGCVALAFAQVIKYHNWPVNGKGSYEYVYQPYGKISANFANTFYDWQNMSNTINSNSPGVNIDAVATLIFHCGVGVNMLYGSGGSGAETPDIRNALVKYFRYSEDAVVIIKKKKIDSIPYSDLEWSNIMKNELLNKRPFVYRGNNVYGYQGHAFVIHGFSDDYFNVNFGWGGYYNGLYYLSSLTPATYNFSYDNQAIINIKPEKAVTVLSPVDNTVDYPASGNLQWDNNGKSNPQKYTVQLSFDNNLNSIEKEYSTSNIYLNKPDIMAGYKYYWKIITSYASGDKEYSQIYSFTTKYPDNEQLYQNYPNPFNPQTTIKFDVKQTGPTKLKIYSAAGEEVATLIDNILEPKEYRITWEPKNLASGVYYYQLETANFRSAKKLILIK
jgi:hypothetical protein